MIEIRNVSKTYKNGIRALKNINLIIQKGEKVTIFGPNGAGKSTLINIIGMLVIPDEGEVRINGHNLISEQKKIKKYISISTANERSFYYRLTLEENLRFFGMLNNVLGKELRIKVEKVLEEMGLAEFRNIKYMEASTGMKRRLSLARALLKGGEIYLLDEPTSGVDIETKIRIYKKIRELAEDGKTVLLASHDVSEIEKTDRIIVLKSGQIISDREVSAVLEQASAKNEEKLLEILSQENSYRK